MKRRFLSIEITTYWHGSKHAPTASSSPKFSTPPNTTRFVLQTLAAGLVLGTLWGIGTIIRHRPALTEAEVNAQQKHQERENRTDRWLNELEENLGKKTNDE
jgi:hypothetical protein